MKHGISELPTTYRRSEKLLAHITRWLITKIGRFFRFSAQSEIYLRWIWVTSWNLHDVSSSASSQKTNPNPKSTSLKPPVLLEEKHRSNTQQTAPAVGGSFRDPCTKKRVRGRTFSQAARGFLDFLRCASRKAAEKMKAWKLSHRYSPIRLIEEIRLNQLKSSSSYFYQGFFTSQVVVWDFFQQQYLGLSAEFWIIKCTKLI